MTEINHDCELILNHTQRITMLEAETVEHTRQITINTLNTEAIADTMKSVKNWIIGATVFYIISQIGFLEFAKGLFQG